MFLCFKIVCTNKLIDLVIISRLLWQFEIVEQWLLQFYWSVFSAFLWGNATCKTQQSVIERYKWFRSGTSWIVLICDVGMDIIQPKWTTNINALKVCCEISNDDGCTSQCFIYENIYNTSTSIAPVVEPDIVETHITTHLSINSN